MQQENPIGIFDSGVGGVSIWKEIAQLLPNESTIYLADSANAPYGQKETDQIVQLCIKNTEKLLELGAKLIVVACNTATTNAIDYLRANYNIPFVGIEPAIKPAALQSTSKSIGILATKGTLNSKLFYSTSKKYTRNIKVIEIIGEGLVPIIESGNLDDPRLIPLLEKYLAPMIEARIDYLVLGCSHYPHLIPILSGLLPKTTTIIDSGAAVARQTKHLLIKHKIASTNENAIYRFFSNGQISALKKLVQATDDRYFFETLSF